MELKRSVEMNNLYLVVYDIPGNTIVGLMTGNVVRARRYPA